MKKYGEYMDSVTVSDTLHEKLKKLEPSAKKAGGWRKYATAAAALALVLGLGTAGLGLRGEAGHTTPARSETELITTEPAIVPDPTPDTPGTETMGGYELAGDGVTSYYLLPAIRYAVTDGGLAADIALPVGVTRRDLTVQELAALFGGADNLADHLDWGGYDLSAHAMVWPDGSLWLLCIYGSAGDTGLEHFTLEVMPGALPPSCYVYSSGEVNQIWGQELTAERHDGEIASSRRVSFLRGGYGYRFDITGADTQAIEALTARLVRWVVAGDGLLLNQNADAPADTPAAEPADGASTGAYDPSADK